LAENTGVAQLYQRMSGCSSRRSQVQSAEVERILLELPGHVARELDRETARHRSPSSPLPLGAFVLVCCCERCCNTRVSLQELDCGGTSFALRQVQRCLALLQQRRGRAWGRQTLECRSRCLLRSPSLLGPPPGPRGGRRRRGRIHGKRPRAGGSSHPADIEGRVDMD